VRTLTGGVGLIAAARFSNESPEWIITGTDEDGVVSAAGAFSQRALDRHFALAVAGATSIAIPLH
jgi:hypothetical protein